MKNIEHAILEGMARTLWADYWSYLEEQQGRTYPGQELNEIAPPTPMEAYLDGARLIGQLEQANGVGIWTLFMRACRADRGEEKASYSMFLDRNLARHFGSDLMLEALGHGVSWYDDHARFDLIVPDFEPSFTIDVDPESGTSIKSVGIRKNLDPEEFVDPADDPSYC